MRSFADGDVIDVEPWRATPFPVIKDLIVDRGAFDRIVAAGGYITAPTGAAPDAQAVPVPKRTSSPRSMRRPASAAERVWRRVPTARQRCS